MKGVVIEINDNARSATSAKNSPTEKRTFENNSAFEYNFKIEGRTAIVTRTAKKDAGIVTDPYVLFADGSWKSAGYIE